MSEQRISIGRIVHYVIPAGTSKGQSRPAICVKVFEENAIGTANLEVFTDGSNDDDWLDARERSGAPGDGERTRGSGPRRRCWRC